LSHFFNRTSTAIIAAAVMLSGLCLAGCGRKAGLDPPPVSSITDERAIGAQAPPSPEVRPDGQPAEVTQLPRDTPLDWLIE
jgi:predicted small lipoprotein YifL